jgi:hypothetical protein
LVEEFFPKTWHIWDKWRIFYFIFTLYAYGIFVKRDKLLSKKIKFKYEYIKFKKRMTSGSCLTSKLYDKIIKMPSKSHETIPLMNHFEVPIFAKLFSCCHTEHRYCTDFKKSAKMLLG